MGKIKETKCIYLIWNTEIKRVKIGVTYHPKKRIETLETQSGCKLELIYHTNPVEQPMEFEKRLHEIFKNYRYLGEWFNINYLEPMEVVKSLECEYKICEIYSMLNQGMNPTQIANKIGVSRSAVVKNMISKGISVKSIRDKFEKKQSVEEFHQDNKSKEIQKGININRGTSLNLDEMVRRNNEKRKLKKTI